MKFRFIDAAALLGAELSYVRDEVFQSKLLGAMRTFVFTGPKRYQVSVCPADHCTVLMVSDEFEAQRSCFTIKGVSPESPKELADYLAQDPAFVGALRGGVLPNTPIDWMGYK